MVEQWCVIEEFPEYRISDQGRVWSEFSNRILRAGLSGSGYLTVSLRTKSNHPITKTVHSLVASSFIGNRKGLQVNHIDGDKLNNHVSNLELIAHQENMNHARSSPFLVSPGRPKLRVKINETGEEFESITDCAEHIRGSKANITACLKGRLRTHKGYTFDLVD